MDLSFLIVLALFGISVAFFVFYTIRRLKPVHSRRMQKASEIVNDMFLNMPRNRIRLMFTASPIVFFIIAFLLFNNLWIAIVAMLLGLLFPTLLLKIMIDNRKAKFLVQLVDTLYIISSSLKAGMTLQQAFDVVVEEMPPPTRDEFKLILRQLKMGVPVADALMTLRKRIKNDDVDIVVISVLVARDTGGNITDVFNNLTNAMREKKRIAKRTKVLTAQARLQTLIITALPFFFVPVVYSQNPHHFDIFFTDPVGQILLVYAIISQILGLFTMKILGNVEV